MSVVSFTATVLDKNGDRGRAKMHVPLSLYPYDEQSIAVTWADMISLVSDGVVTRVDRTYKSYSGTLPPAGSSRPLDGSKLLLFFGETWQDAVCIIVPNPIMDLFRSTGPGAGFVLDETLPAVQSFIDMARGDLVGPEGQALGPFIVGGLAR